MSSSGRHEKFKPRIHWPTENSFHLPQVLNRPVWRIQLIRPSLNREQLYSMAVKCLKIWANLVDICACLLIHGVHIARKIESGRVIT